jgi:hypothetical protein
VDPRGARPDDEIELVELMVPPRQVDGRRVTQPLSKPRPRGQSGSARALWERLGAYRQDHPALLLGCAIYTGVLTVVLLAWTLS